ncbi:hypothetical protein [Bacillus xiapuensis]|uniref:hypothetical protein n=1 Tax=Bacillus xiapuensis TaxID=2014075 RepID=UPI0012FD7074|nr:hypothetical protein [Bacillus xiapuensis]
MEDGQLNRAGDQWRALAKKMNGGLPECYERKKGRIQLFIGEFCQPEQLKAFLV